MRDSEYLSELPKKFFKDPYLADNCSYCNTRMIHPELQVYICPNPDCRYKFKFSPENKDNSVEVLHHSKLVKRYGR